MRRPSATLFVSLVVLLCSRAPEALATDQDLAWKLGSVIGSEEFCGLSYDQGAIEAFVARNVSENDMAFAAELDDQVGGTKVENKEMSASEKTAHCTQIRRVAKSFGFIH